MKIGTILTATVLALSLTACGSTWRGAKQDTRANVEKTKEVVKADPKPVQKPVDRRIGLRGQTMPAGDR